ncbi:MAG: nitroreductase [Methanoculleus sp. SDB]|nr:MAG: nitroreductase [Methanoculleus sp. SDB]
MQDQIRTLVTTSRSTRRFREKERIPNETLRDLIDIARFCPSARNRQPLRYVLSIDPEETERITDCLVWALDLPEWDGPARGERPAAYITIVTEPNPAFDPCYDIGIAAQTILLAAAERGLAGCMMGSIRKDALRSVLDLADDYAIRLVIALGYPAETIVIEPLPESGDTRYWRDARGVHHVPKRSLEACIIRR